MMRIGNNSQGIWQLFSRMNGNNAFGRSSGAGGRNTLEDQLTGHRKIPTVWRECALPTIPMQGKSSKYLMR